MTAIISTNAFAHGSHAEQSINRLTEQVHVLQQKNIIPKVDVNYIIKPTEEINKQRVEAVANLNIVSHNCTVDIHVSPEMKVSHSGSNHNREFLKDVTGSSNENQENLRTSYLTYHETSHCKLYEVKNPFKAADKDAEYMLNKYFQYSSSSYGSKNGDIGLYYMLQENFADTFAFIQLIKNHGVNKDVLSTMQKIQVERSDAANEYNKNGLIAHNTEFALKEIIKEENIKKIISTNNQEELQEIALKIANDGMWKSIKTHSNMKSSDQIINVESLINGSSFLLQEFLYKDLGVDNPLSSEKNVNLQLEDNVLYQVAKDSQLKLEEKFNLSSIKSIAEMKDFYNNNYEEIGHILQEELAIKMDVDFKNGKDPFIVIENYFKNVEAGNKQSLPELKSKGAEAIQTAENLASKLSTDSVLKNISSFRQSHTNIPNKTVHIKYGQ